MKIKKLRSDALFGEPRLMTPSGTAPGLTIGQSGSSGGISPSPVAGPGGIMQSGMVTIPPPSTGPITAPPPSGLHHQGQMAGLSDLEFVQDRVESLVRDWIGIHMQTPGEAELQQPFTVLISQVSVESQGCGVNL